MDRHQVLGAAPAPAPVPGVARAGRVLLAVAAGLGLITGLSGCQIVIGMLMLFKGLPTQDCDFKQFTKKTLDEKGKKVVIVASAAGPALLEQPSLNVDIITQVSRKLRTQKINVVDSHEVARHLDDAGEITDETDLADLGRQFKADYIILFKFDDFGFREANSINLYRGHARGKVLVVEMTDKGADGKRIAKTIYKKPFESKYPMHQPIQADQESPSVFAQRFLAQMSEELARLFYDHRPGEDM